MHRRFIYLFCCLVLLSVSMACKKEKAVPVDEQFFSAVRNDDYEKVEKLVQKHPDLVGRLSAQQYTALDLCAQLNHARTAGVLIAAGADVNRISVNDESPLMRSVWADHPRMVELLLGKGALVNQTDYINNNTPLFYAARSGNRQMVDLLVRHGADLKHKNKAGFSALDYAGMDDAVGMVDYLYGLDPFFRQQLVLDRALLTTASYGSTHAAGALLGKGASINGNEGLKATPLQAATGRVDMVAFLISRGADVNHVNAACGTTPLHSACSFYPVADIVTLLIQAGARVNVADAGGKTPLIAASKAGFGDGVAVLLDNGADVYRNDREGNTALHYAVLNDDTAMADMLLRHHARMDVLNKAGKSPRDMARSKQMKALLQKGAFPTSQ